MHELTPDELLSAYLDGELTADEQLRVERLLAEDDQARRLFDELRRMRSCLQGLPPQELPDDFASRVLRSAERQMLAAAPAAMPANETAWQERLRRPLAYVAIVLAASVLIAIFNPDAPRIDNPRHTVVLAPKAARPEPQPVDAFTHSFDAPSISAAPDPAAERGEQRSGEAAPRNIGKLAKERSEEQSTGLGAPAPPANKGGPAGASTFADGIAKNAQGLPQSDNGLLVVTCEITPSAARQDSFRRVLTRNQISLEDAQSPQVAQNQPAAPAPANRESSPKRAASDTGLEVVYVEATQEQLEATLADMATQSKEFLSVDVGAAETWGVQNRWQEQYSRGRGGMTQQRFLAPAIVSDAAKQPAPSASATELARPTAPKPATTAPQSDDAGLANNRSGQVAGRARAYSMPSEGFYYQNAPPPVMLQQQQRLSASESRTGQKQEAKGDAAAPQPIGKASGAVGQPSHEPATLRALFVLRVADDQKPADK